MNRSERIGREGPPAAADRVKGRVFQRSQSEFADMERSARPNNDTSTVWTEMLLSTAEPMSLLVEHQAKLAPCPVARELSGQVGAAEPEVEETGVRSLVRSEGEPALAFELAVRCQHRSFKSKPQKFPWDGPRDHRTPTSMLRSPNPSRDRISPGRTKGDTWIRASSWGLARGCWSVGLQGRFGTGLGCAANEPALGTPSKGRMCAVSPRQRSLHAGRLLQEW